jgi:hypothetical protein
MSRIDISTRELFLRLGATPRARSARADQLFRRLRTEDAPAEDEEPPRRGAGDAVQHKPARTVFAR